MVLWVLVFIGRRQQVNHLGSLNTLFPPSIYGIDGSKVIMTVYKFKVASRDLSPAEQTNSFLIQETMKTLP